MGNTQEVYAICEEAFIPNQRCKSFVLAREGPNGEALPWQILVLRWGPDFYGYVNRCPHDKNPLNFEANQFFDNDRRFLLCGKHGALFDVTTGVCVEGPCRGDRLEPVSLLVLDGDVCVTGVRLMEDDGADSEDTMEVMIHPD